MKKIVFTLFLILMIMIILSYLQNNSIDTFSTEKKKSGMPEPLLKRFGQDSFCSIMNFENGSFNTCIMNSSKKKLI